MKLSRQFTTVTPLSKFIALMLFIALPFIGFYLGMKYSQSLSSGPVLVYISHAASNKVK